MSITKKHFSTLDIVMMALFVAILSVSAYISVQTPFSLGQITFLNFIIIIIGLTFSLPKATIIVVVWLLLGAFGVPVFVGGKSGFAYLISPVGGYTFAFLFAIIFLCLLRGKKYNMLRFAIVSVLGAILIDAIGMIWLKFMGNLSWKAAFLGGFIAFIPLDMVKAVVAGVTAPALRKIIN